MDADVAGTESRAGAVGCSAVEWNADDRDVELFGLGDIGEAAKRGDAAEARVFEGVDGLRMRKAELADALEFLLGHEAEMLGAALRQVNRASQARQRDNAEAPSAGRLAEKRKAKKEKQIPYFVRDDTYRRGALQSESRSFTPRRCG